jgi:Ran GTPase-activating protein (RanGAP) involved in mRNA processing and transport
LLNKVDIFNILQEVILPDIQITDEGLKALAKNGSKFRYLKVVSLENNQITDEGLKALAKNGNKFQTL